MIDTKLEINNKLKDIDYFLNECKKCNLKFENSKQLMNHANKFCINSGFNDINKLEEKFNKNIQFIQENNKNEDLFKVFDSDKDQDYDILIKKLRDMEIHKDWDNLKNERNKIRLEKIDEENKYTKILEEFERKKREEIKAYIEKQKIKKQLRSLEKEKIEILKNEKTLELEKIERQKQNLCNLEKDIKLEVKRIQNQIQEVDQIYKKEEEKINNLGDNIKKYSNIDQKNLYKNHFETKIEKISNLRAKRWQLEDKKIFIDNQINDHKKIKNYADFKYKNLGLINYELKANINLNKSNKMVNTKDSLDYLMKHSEKDIQNEKNILKNRIMESIRENERIKEEINNYNLDENF